MVWDYKKVGFIKIYYLTLKSEPVYSTYNAYKDKPLFDSTLPVGYIIGADNNTLGMMGEKEADVRAAVATARKTFEAARIIHIVKCCALYGLLTGSVKYANYCESARDWCDDLDGQICDLLGSDENDGLVAKESQYYPKSFYNPATGKYEEVHSSVLSPDSRGYSEFHEFNHAVIAPGSNERIQTEINTMLNALEKYNR